MICCTTSVKIRNYHFFSVSRVVHRVLWASQREQLLENLWLGWFWSLCQNWLVTDEAWLYHISVFTSWFGGTMTEMIYWSSFWTLRGAPNSWKTRHFHTKAFSRKQATCQNTSMSGLLSTFDLLFSIICVFWNYLKFIPVSYTRCRWNAVCYGVLV